MDSLCLMYLTWVRTLIILHVDCLLQVVCHFSIHPIGIKAFCQQVLASLILLQKGSDSKYWQGADRMNKIDQSSRKPSCRITFVQRQFRIKK